MRPRQTVALVERLVIECGRQAEKPPIVNGVPDRYISMFAVALKNSLVDLPVSSQEQLAKAVSVKEDKGPFPPEFVFNYMLRDIQMVSAHDPENPEEYDKSYPYETQEEWNERVNGIVLDDEKFQHLTFNMMMWNVGSDVETRAAGLKLVAHILLKEQVNDVNEPFRILNVGSARDHTLAMISGNVEFPEVSVAGFEMNPEKQKFLQDIINKLLAREIHLSDSYGVDLWPLRDEEWSKFLESCRFYPSELNDPVKRHMYKYLEQVRDASPILHHVEADFGEDNIDFDVGFNIIAFITSLYQSHQDKQRRMVDKAIKYHTKQAEIDAKNNIKPKRRIIKVQDFCEVNDANELDHPIDRLKFTGPTSKPFTYGTFVYDTDQPELGFQVFGYWNNGRCEKFRPGEIFLDSISKHYKQDSEAIV